MKCLHRPCAERLPEIELHQPVVTLQIAARTDLVVEMIAGNHTVRLFVPEPEQRHRILDIDLPERNLLQRYNGRIVLHPGASPDHLTRLHWKKELRTAEADLVPSFRDLFLKRELAAGCHLHQRRLFVKTGRGSQSCRALADPYKGTQKIGSGNLHLLRPVVL